MYFVAAAHRIGSQLRAAGAAASWGMVRAEWLGVVAAADAAFHDHWPSITYAGEALSTRTNTPLVDPKDPLSVPREERDLLFGGEVLDYLGVGGDNVAV